MPDLGQSGGRDPAQEAFRMAYWKGYYEACRALTTSVRMNKPQIEVIEDQAWTARQALEEMGVKFDD